MPRTRAGESARDVGTLGGGAPRRSTFFSRCDRGVVHWISESYDPMGTGLGPCRKKHWTGIGLQDWTLNPTTMNWIRKFSAASQQKEQKIIMPHRHGVKSIVDTE